MPYRIKGIATLRYTDAEMSVPRLTADGNHVEGWIFAPAGKVWQPHDHDPLLWLPPSATKATDVDQAGSIVDVTELGDRAWITAQLNRHDKYLDTIRDKVRNGRVRLTAFLAKMLGLPFEDGAELMPYNPVPGPMAAYKAAASLEQTIRDTVRYDQAAGLREDGERLIRLARMAGLGRNN